MSIIGRERTTDERGFNLNKSFKSIITIVVCVTIALAFAKDTKADSQYKRINGSDRLSTAIEISKRGWPNGLDSSEKAVIIARADNPADALSAASLSSVKDAPILLTFSDTISWRVLKELDRLNVSKVYVLGGEQAINRKVVATLQSKKYKVERISGSGRYQTAANINKVAGTSKKTKAIIVNGTAIADALSASSDSAINQVPIYLTTKNSLPVNLPSSIKSVDLYGGIEVISKTVESQLSNKGIKINRFAGSGRYETNIKALNNITQKNNAILVRGTSVSKIKEDYPDAVVASGLAHRIGAVVVLSHEQKGMTSVTNYLNNQDFASVYVLGGNAAISDSLINAYQIEKPLNQLKGIDQVVMVTTEKTGDRNATVTLYNKKNGNWLKMMNDLSGVVGKNGISSSKREGDGKSPKGIYHLKSAFGTSNKPSNVKLPYTKTNKNYYWVDDTNSKDYNKMKYYNGNPNNLWRSYEKLTHPLYSHAVVIEYNTNPVVKGKGSAIFLHTKAQSTKYTLGCVAIPKTDLVNIMRQLDPNLNPHIIITESNNLNQVVHEF